MTTEIRSQLNVRIDNDTNMSVSVSSFVDTEEEAREAGMRNSAIVSAYIAGYAEATQEGAG